MLAFKFKDHQDGIKYPIVIQPKLDGIRGLYYNGKMQSRDEVIWCGSIVEHVVTSLYDGFDGWVLDGEFYVHGWTLQKINKNIAVKRVALAHDTKAIEFHVFDGFNIDGPYTPFIDRMSTIETIFNGLKDRRSVRVVKTDLVSSPIVAEQMYVSYKQAGYEGIMYRDPSAPYGFVEDCTNKENRWRRLLKRKDWLDDWFSCIGWETGKGKNLNQIGVLTCTTEDGKLFEVGTGLSDEERQSFMSNRPYSIHVQFETYSEGGIPLKPVYLEGKFPY